MFKRRPIETVMAILVILGTLAFTAYSLRLAEPDPSGGGLSLHALFRQVDGLQLGAPVRLSGVGIGKVTAISLDPATYQVRVDVIIDRTVEVFGDSALSIKTSGLFGGKFVELDPGGGDERRLKSGDGIPIVQNSVLLDELVARIVSFGEDARRERGAPK